MSGVSVGIPVQDGWKVVKTGHTGHDGVVDVTAPIASAVFAMDTANYDDFLVDLHEVRPATNSSHLYVQVSADGGATWHTSGYLGFGYRGTVATAFSIGLIAGISVSSTAALAGVSTQVFLYGAGDASQRTTGHIQGRQAYSSGFTPYTLVGAMNYNTDEAHNAVRVVASSGQLGGGQIRLLGRKR